MKTNNTVASRGKQNFSAKKLTIVMDLGDRFSYYCVLDEAGEVLMEQKLPTTKAAMQQAFGRMPRSRVALETGAHSPWVSRLLMQLGHEVIVAHARNVRLIGESSRKDDRLDARMLARLARLDPRLLSPVRHRSAKAQIDLTVIRARAALVGARTALVNAARGLAKSYGERLRKCGTQQVNQDLAAGLSAELREALEPLLAEVASLNQRITEYDRRIEQIATKEHPEVALLKQIKGGGNTDRVDICADTGRSTPVSPEPRCRLLSGAAVGAQELREERTATAHQQGRRPLPAHAAGARSAVHFGSVWTGQRSAALGTEARRAGRKECQEASGGGGGAEAGRIATQVVGERRSL